MVPWHSPADVLAPASDQADRLAPATRSNRDWPRIPMASAPAVSREDGPSARERPWTSIGVTELNQELPQLSCVTQFESLATDVGGNLEIQVTRDRGIHRLERQFELLQALRH